MARVLLIAPTFFGYRAQISTELSRRGHVVDVADDRPSESVFFKSIAKVSLSPLDQLISRYADSLEERLSENRYDKLIYLGGMTFCFTHAQMERLRSSTGAEFVAYLWDSLANSRRLAATLDIFDRALSFDPKDCVRTGMALRPLFFSARHQRVPLEPQGGFEWDACFVGSVHQPSKYEAVSSICDELKASGQRVFDYLYMPSRSAELLRKATCASYRGRTFRHRALSADEVSGVYTRSKAIVDSPQDGQNGLTMRTIEAVGCRRKLVTSNPEALCYDFASTGQVLVWDGSSETVADFFSKPFEELSDEVYQSYSIKSFVDALMGEAGPFCGYSYKECGIS